MDRLFHHVLRGLVVVLGLESAHVQANVLNFPDDGAALAACQADHATAIGQTAPIPNSTTTAVTRSFQRCLPANSSGNVNVAPITMFRCQVEWVRQDTQTVIGRDRCNPPVYAPQGNHSEYRFTASCATRPWILNGLVRSGQNYACERGCLYAQGATYRAGPDGTSVWVAWYLSPTGATCTVGPGRELPLNPGDDQDGDGIPNGQDPVPNGPNPGPNDPPPPPLPEPPPPPGPNDPVDDGQQIASDLGPKLDRIEQAVLGLGPRLDGLRASVDGARADANADADGIRSALDGIRSAIVAQGPNAGSGEGPGEGDGPPDLSPLNPGPDGGEHPGLSSIVEQGDAGQLLGQLDTDGFGFGRSCPAYAWPLSFDLGWANINIQQSVGIVCTALAILGFIIGLAGLIQASFILGRIGAT